MSEPQEKILAFDNQFFEFGTQIVTGVECVSTPFPLISEGENHINLKLTGIELRQILSSIQIGAEWAYPDQSHQILFNFMKGLICMTFCEDVADCVSDPESPAAIAVTEISQNITEIEIEENNTIINQDRNLTPEAEGFLEKRFKELQREDPVLPPSGTCNTARKNEVFAGTLEIVNRVAEMAQDFLEDVNTQADSVQRAARTVALVPIIGDAVGETILAFAEVVPDILNLYLSHDSIAQHEDVACDLFCMHIDECGYPTFDELINHYKALGITSISDIANVSMNALIDAVTGTNSLAASVVWYAMNTFVLYFMYVESTFLGRRGVKWIKIYAGNGELLPNDDWMLLCDCGITQWDWAFDTDSCSYGLPSGWSLNVTAGACGAPFNGIWDTTTSAPAIVVVTVSFPAQLISNIRMGGYINGPHASNGGTVHLSAGTVSSTQSLGQAPTIDNHNWTVDEIISSFTITATHSTSTQNPRLAVIKTLAVNT